MTSLMLSSGSRNALSLSTMARSSHSRPLALGVDRGRVGDPAERQRGGDGVEGFGGDRDADYGLELALRDRSIVAPIDISAMVEHLAGESG
jgi:hypothetical protein